MSEEKITQLIRQIHEEKVYQDFVGQVLEETKLGVSKSLNQKVSNLLEFSENQISKKVIPFARTKPFSLGKTTLLAAAGEKLGTWFEHPLVFPSSGMVVDIRRIVGSENEVDIYIQSNSEDESVIQQSLRPFKDTSISIRMTLADEIMLDAEIYIDDSACFAEGHGRLSNVEKNDLSGDIDFQVILD